MKKGVQSTIQNEGEESRKKRTDPQGMEYESIYNRVGGGDGKLAEELT